MNLNDFIHTGLPALGAGGAIAWFLWQRYQALEKRLTETDKQIVEVKHNVESNRQAVQANGDRHEYLINSNRELIEHRTNRFQSEIRALESRLSKDIDEVKGFLERTTEFRIRGQ